MGREQISSLVQCPESSGLCQASTALRQLKLSPDDCVNDFDV